MGGNATCPRRSFGAALSKSAVLLCAAGFIAIALSPNAVADRCLDATAVSQPILAPAAATQTSQPSDQAAGQTRRDGGLRMVAPVQVAGQGPFPFIVDTGANRTAISRELAERLGMTPTGSGEVNSVYGIAVAPLVPAQRLEYASLPLPANNEMPLIAGAVLAGQAGLLGVDSMRGKRLRLDFERRCIEIGPAITRFSRSGWTTVQGQLRFGNLIVVQGRVERQNVNILIDTGSDSTLANLAFRDQLARTIHLNPQGTTAARAYTMGEPVLLNSAVLIPSLRIGGVEVGHVTAYVGDFHVFHLWDMTSEPTLLIGMDVLSRTRAIVIDFSDGAVYFRLRPQVMTGSRIPTTMSDAQVITR